MKSVYNKPFVKKIDFFFGDQVVAATGYFYGSHSAREDTGYCQYSSTALGGCNRMFNVLSRGINDCTEQA